jgi:hypothetical protein
MRVRYGLLVGSLLVGLPASALAKCGDDPADPTAVAAARAAVVAACPCYGFPTHRDYISCASGVVVQRVATTLLRKRCKGAVMRCAAKSVCGKPGAVACCRTMRTGATKCSVKRDGSRCVPPRGGSACVSQQPSCCDACGPGGCGSGSTSTTSTSTTTSTTLSGCSEGRDTFDVIQERIFSGHGCNVSTCHGPLGQANLDLRYGAAYGSLVDVPAFNAVALAAGKLRVKPGDAAASFLSQKLHGTLLPGEGSQMPLVGTLLDAVELAVVDAWINAGAPQTGEVPGAPCLPPLSFTPAEPLTPPPGGYQLVLNGPWLQPGEEQEGCLWVPVPNTTSDFYTDKWEFSLNPGTHHFAVYTNRADVPSPPTNQWLLNDFGCFLEADFGASLSGSPQAPYFVDAYPSGVARVLRRSKYLGLNAHYHNDFDVPIQIKVWVNIYPFVGTPQHIAQTLTSLDTTFGIDVPPFTQKIQPGRFVNGLGRAMSFLSVSGHMHKRGLRFTAWRSNGVKLYENFDWAHPVPILFEPPFVLQPGDWIDYECLHDNGVTRPVKRDALGNPTNLRFGVTTDDEMCILPGTYYTD